ncbi:hypothetical protein GCM10027169_13500 [Gordonia jinhuaensis]|uniref:Low molecular weight protein antigen 6 PH domain-containing protein n=1 Tax=Gordonia jinhuaensis TaxID=1517702 RepID=A0A916WPR6_9ACTN|nr:hypothetical protein GCM10011489_08840 [Gordonia jinhuaensis]
MVADDPVPGTTRDEGFTDDTEANIPDVSSTNANANHSDRSHRATAAISTTGRATSDRPAVRLPLTIRIQPVAYFAPAMMFVTAIILAGTSLPYLGWTLVLPVVLAVWIWRLRTVVTADGLVSVRTFATTVMPWDTIAGLRFTRWGATKAVRTDGTSVSLPAVTFGHLPVMSAASSGRIPDPYAAAADAAAEKTASPTSGHEPSESASNESASSESGSIPPHRAD